VIENFVGTESRRKFLKELKEKVDIFIGTKNIFKTKKLSNLVRHFPFETFPS